MEKGEKRLQTLNEQGAEGITPAELLRNDNDPYKAVVSGKLEALGQIQFYEEKLRVECPETVIFPTPAEDEHLEQDYDSKQSGDLD